MAVPLVIFSFIVRTVLLGGMSLSVVQQDNPNYIADGTEVTQFQMASHYGNIGLLAHNTLAGQYFYDLQINQIIAVQYADGHIEEFRVREIRQYQALEPANVHSDFIDLETGHKLSAIQIFDKYYKGDHHLTLQTCLTVDGNDSWGRIFIIAYPK